MIIDMKYTSTECKLCGIMVQDFRRAWLKHYINIHKFKEMYFTNSKCRLCGSMVEDSRIGWTKHYERVHKFGSS